MKVDLIAVALALCLDSGVAIAQQSIVDAFDLIDSQLLVQYEHGRLPKKYVFPPDAITNFQVRDVVIKAMMDAPEKRHHPRFAILGYSRHNKATTRTGSPRQSPASPVQTAPTVICACHKGRIAELMTSGLMLGGRRRG